MGRAAADSARMHIGANGGYESHLRRSVAWSIIEAGSISRRFLQQVLIRSGVFDHPA